jgi:hypothetical protein
MHDIRTLFAGLGDLDSEPTVLSPATCSPSSTRKPNCSRSPARTLAGLSQRLETTYAALVDGHIDELHGWITAWALSTPTQEVKALATRGIYSQVGRSTTKSDGASRPCRIRC